MNKSVAALRNELVNWIENTADLEILQKIEALKNEQQSLIGDINQENFVDNNFDQQFAAGMSSDELLENVAAHIESIDSEKSSVVSDVQSEYPVKDDFDERFAKGISVAESRKKTREFIANLPWKR